MRTRGGIYDTTTEHDQGGAAHVGLSEQPLTLAAVLTPRVAIYRKPGLLTIR